MKEQDAERILREALAAQARATVGDDASPPPPRFATGAGPRRRRPLRLLAPLAAAAAVLAVTGGIVAIADHSGSGSGGTHGVTVAGGAGTHTATSAPVASDTRATVPSSTVPPLTKAVHIRLFNADGARYGVGMPIVAYFSRRFTDARALAAATSVSVDGAPMTAAWYFVPSTSASGPIEGHLRPQNYWPAHAQVHVAMKTQGLSAGGGLAFDDSLTLDFSTGARTVAVVRDSTHDLTVTTDGQKLGPYPVSLGSQQTPTTRGVKVIIDKQSSVCMKGPGFQECGVRYPQQLTYAGEYLHSAPWNVGNIQRGIDSSNGCTNLRPTDAALLYKMLEVGDVVDYVDATGAPMTVTEGFGDWNVSWARWLTGGILPTH